MGPIPLREFERMVKEAGFLTGRTAKNEGKILTPEGNLLMTFGIRHGRLEVKPVYVKRFLSLVEASREDENE